MDDKPKRKITWHEYGLSLFVIVAALTEFVRARSNGDWGGMFGFMLLPVILWGIFYYRHSWAKEHKPLNWIDSVLGILGWMGALSIMLPKH